MGSNYYSEPKRSDCPNCGASESAIMGSSEWGHNIECCSQSCGMEIKAKIEANEAKAEFSEAVIALETARERVRELRYEGIDLELYPYEAQTIWGW